MSRDDGLLIAVIGDEVTLLYLSVALCLFRSLFTVLSELRIETAEHCFPGFGM